MHNLSYCDIAPDRMKELVRNWLARQDLPYDKIIFTNGSKVQACLDNKIDIFVEDAPKYITETAKYIPTICFDARFNRTCQGDNIYHCHSVYDMYYLIKNLSSHEKSPEI